VCVFPSSREPTRRQTLASPSRTAAYLLPKTPSGRLWLECRPELRNHGVGWMRAVERLRNGGVPRNPVFLMPATHCTTLVVMLWHTIPSCVAVCALRVPFGCPRAAVGRVIAFMYVKEGTSRKETGGCIQWRMGGLGSRSRRRGQRRRRWWSAGARASTDGRRTRSPSLAR